MNAKEILLKAIRCDQAGRILEAETLYHEGIQLLMDFVNVEKDAAKKKALHERIKEYINRAEQIHERVKRHISEGKLVSHIPIEDDSTGNSYQTLFGKYINSDTKEVLVEEPYLIEKYQFRNLIAFFEVLTKSSGNLKFISLLTKTDTKSTQKQLETLQQIKDNLTAHGITLNIQFQNSLHDRRIVLSNGYIIKIGRGLHIFKPITAMYGLGLSDYDFRKCLQTDVDIWRTKNIS